MKTFKSEDQFKIVGQRCWSIRRSDPWAKLKPDEMPKVGDAVEVDGEQITVGDVQQMHGSFGFSAHFVIKEAK